VSASLTGEAQVARVAPQTGTLQRRDGAQILTAGQHLDPARGAESIAAADMAVVDPGGKDRVEQTLSRGGRDGSVVVAECE
jgi:hypothetical protein